ncbi:cytochrome c oxidase subunit II [Marinilabilia rubra]|uniref:Cytochrome c oxidase subunit 2 n=1 Tax=Marinilabilia rubra TaxID=2162893 RepID=A0A2U2BA07_9BACT|nr:cytochrome c oxidase subunit II [Marinilabilia rubra]PWD99887.1 cytochrome c oxidase subunit II [Marinilabilia rubra]
MFDGASNLAQGVDNAFFFIFAVAFVFIVGITAFMIYIVVKYKRSKGKPAMQFSRNIKLEVIWTVIPLILVILMFYYGWVGFAPMRKVPKDALEITAIGRMWEWEFDYGDGKVAKELVIPVNKPVRLNLKSEDVNHSLFIPAFRVKEDVVPGYDNYLWFTPYYIGDYEILCTEYCGLLHSSMVSKTRVLAEEEYEDWLANLEATGDIPDPEGLVLLRETGCLACHSLDGSKLVGPSFKGVYNSERVVVDSNEEITIVADEEYLKRSIYEPDEQLVKGFNKGLMQSYEGTVTGEEADLMIDYLKELE